MIKAVKKVVEKKIIPIQRTTPMKPECKYTTAPDSTVWAKSSFSTLAIGHLKPKSKVAKKRLEP